VLSPETAGPIVESVAPRGEAFDPSLKSAAGLVVLTGRGVARGRTLGEVAVVDLAPTFTTLLGVRPPAQAAGKPLPRALATNDGAGSARSE
jgi:hypothetical protein